MKRLLLTTAFSFFLPATLTLMAQAQRQTARSAGAEAHDPTERIIMVSRAGTVFAKPDLAILVMTIQSSAPLTQEAVSENARKAKNVESALATLGYAPNRHKVTSVVFGRTGGPYYGPNQPANTGIEVSQFVYVFFEGPELSDAAQLTGKAAATIDALRTAGAVPGSVPAGRYLPPGQGGMIIYTVKNSEEYERQAMQQAVRRARAAAQDIAEAMQVRITGLRSVGANYLSGQYLPGNGVTQLEGLPYRFFSTEADGVEISANATVRCDFQ